MATATSTAAATAAVARELASLVREGRNFDAIDRLYSPGIVSIEPVGDDQTPAVVTGIDAVRRKNQEWFETNELHSARINGPFIDEDQFAMHYEWDTTHKPTGQRFSLAEMALYAVQDGKIVREQFFYYLPPK